MVELQQAYDKLRAAEPSKDIDPDRYNKARTAYYSLAEGPEWERDERKRLLEEARGITGDWKNQYEMLQSQRQSQVRNLELVRAAKDSTLGLKEDVKFAVEQIQALIRREHDRKNVDERLSQFASRPGGGWEPPGWLLTFLDFLIVGLLFYNVWVAYKKYGQASVAPSVPILSET